MKKIPSITTSRMSQLREKVRDAVVSNTTAAHAELKRSIVEQAYLDPLGIAAETIPDAPFWDAGNPRRASFESWLQGINKWKSRYQDPGKKESVDTALYTLWDAFEQQLKTQLDQAARYIPARSSILAFVAGSRRCIVLQYSIVHKIVELEPLAVIDDPKSLFDFWGTIDKLQGQPAAQNALKQFLTSGHKMVYHRGTLIHVDRRTEASVFGPTIDTVVLGEVLVRHIIERSEKAPASVLEVGSGSGMLSAVILRNAKIARLAAVDLDLGSVACTARNCRLAAGVGSTTEMHFVNGSFSPKLFGIKFDLCVCNPPYIPLPPTSPAAGSTFMDNRRATGGTELLESLVRDADQLIAPGGRLVLITSNLSRALIDESLPEGFCIDEPFGSAGIPVVFDVDSVVTDPAWLDFLKKTGGLTQSGAHLTHSLHTVILQRCTEK